MQPQYDVLLLSFSKRDGSIEGEKMTQDVDAKANY